ncbi:MAG: asparagine synthase (glutamine-hydrolyzing) [Gammaproteobacteria bacterium]|jgi:asparagine synthase (glutamine-hydrolysing)
MCGVVAYYAYHHAACDVSRDAVSRVAEAMRARGPDGHGEWFSNDGRVVLAHRRLAVIGPGNQGAQPMADARGTQVLSFNGAIYNHVELRSMLELRGQRFCGSSDTEVILAMYREFGDAMLEQLRGMFAFALWDGEAKELILARDAYGIKPLYYADDGWTLRVASQVRALSVDSAVSADPDPAGWAGFYLLGSVPEPFTTRRAIRSVPAGALIRCGKAGPLPTRRWFDLAEVVRGERGSSPEGDRLAAETEKVPAVGRQTMQRRVRDALLESVEAHFVADVPIGLFLSSGIDSAVMLALAHELGHRPKAITLAFDEFSGSTSDESVLAAQLAAELGVEHHVRRVSAAEFDAEVPAILAAMDQPSIDGVNAWFVSKAAAEQGLKVAISGIGGDELMAGYPSFRQLPWLAQLGKFPARIPWLRDVLTRMAIPLVRELGWHPKYAGVFSLAGSYERAWLLRRSLFMPWELANLLGEDEAAHGLARLQPLHMLTGLLQPDPMTARGRVTVLESAMYLRNQLLRDADWAGMAHGVEIRMPLVDSTLLRALAPDLMQVEIGEGKDLLARSPARRLPSSMLGRSKTGFQVPLQRWMQASGSAVKEKVPGHVAAVRQWAQRVARAQ